MTIYSESIPMVVAMGDENYAWQLLQSEILLKTSKNLTGVQISNLLTLYMKGVERLNSFADKRQQFFQNKITELMNNPDVIQLLTLSKEQQEKSKGILKNTLTYEQTIEKKKNMEQNLSKQLMNDALIYTQVIAKHQIKAESIQSKVKEIVKSSGDKLESRIMSRKIKSLSARSNHDSMYQQVIQSFKGKLNNMSDPYKDTDQNVNFLNRGRTSSSKEISVQSSKRRNTCYTTQQTNSH